MSHKYNLSEDWGIPWTKEDYEREIKKIRDAVVPSGDGSWYDKFQEIVPGCTCPMDGNYVDRVDHTAYSWGCVAYETKVNATEGKVTLIPHRKRHHGLELIRAMRGNRDLIKGSGPKPPEIGDMTEDGEFCP